MEPTGAIGTQGVDWTMILLALIAGVPAMIAAAAGAWVTVRGQKKLDAKVSNGVTQLLATSATAATAAASAATAAAIIADRREAERRMRDEMHGGEPATKPPVVG